ncbi:hypothetical protein E3E12_00660 [Formicincola oecophyllae]|uniref:CHRD domain-containing protein n=1 Tax=Formicincola oecophyllae TaxID=2558361 RepID=A0A4Y6U933_9PROT|nr:hypothetical protein [Formicincola oecophyllae]QDH12957.2 hypothetical protein E3E12_00660 [Formicincola oecophyllae]
MTSTTSQHRIALFRSSLLLPLMGALAVTPALADTLGDLPASCFSYEPGQAHVSGNTLTERDFSAKLGSTGYALKVGNVTLKDASGHVGGDDLGKIQATAAYGVLVAHYHGLPAACAHHSFPNVTLLVAGQPDLQWGQIRLDRPGHNLTARSAHLETLQTTPKMVVRFSAQGLHEPNHPLVPSQASGVFTFTPNPNPPFDVSFDHVNAVMDGSRITGSGHVLAASNFPSSSGEMHVSITNIGPLIDKASHVVPATTTGALVIARMMGKSEGPDQTGWDVTLHNGKVRINSIKIPIAVGK